MRQYKFRVWDKRNKKMVYPDTYCCDLAIQLNGELWCHDSYYDIRHNDFIIQQWTGLIGFKGVDIYEGDIVTNSDKSSFMEIGFRNGRFGAIHNIYKEYCMDLDVEYFSRYCEVVGNIYENPELIKQPH